MSAGSGDGIRSILLRIESRLEHVALAARAAGALAGFIGLPQEEVGEVQLCVAEAANNSIKHAYAGRTDGIVEIRCFVSDTELVIEISDEGTPMPGGLPRDEFHFDPDDTMNLPESGMGLHIILSSMDDVAYSTADGRNRLTLRKKIALARSAT